MAVDQNVPLHHREAPPDRPSAAAEDGPERVLELLSTIEELAHTLEARSSTVLANLTSSSPVGEPLSEDVDVIARLVRIRSALRRTHQVVDAQWAALGLD